MPKVRRLVEGLPSVEHVYGGFERRAIGLDHARAGELIAMADARSWFTYYYWNDDRRAPDFARTVEIHRKLGYDPVELFLDPSIAAPKAAIRKRLLLRKLGFRTLMDVIPLVYVESTGHGIGGEFYDMVQRAQQLKAEGKERRDRSGLKSSASALEQPSRSSGRSRRRSSRHVVQHQRRLRQRDQRDRADHAAGPGGHGRLGRS